MDIKGFVDFLKRKGFSISDYGTQNPYIELNGNKIRFDLLSKKYSVDGIAHQHSRTFDLSKIDCENFSVVMFLIKLFKKGYNYSVITLEKSWQLGHDDKGYLDIMIKNPSNNDIYMVEVKTSETIKKYVDNKHEKDTKQVLSYAMQERSTKILSFYAYDFENEKDEFYNIYTENILKDSQNVDDFYERWNKQFDNEDYIETNDIFNIQQSIRKYANLEEITGNITQLLFNQFATILRQYSISDKPSAFMKMINLLLAKISDESTGDKKFNSKDTQWAPAGYECGIWQKKLTSAKTELVKVKTGGVETLEDERFLTVIAGETVCRFDKYFGLLDTVRFRNREMLASPVKMNFWRAPIDNDRPLVENWRNCGLDRLIQKTYSVNVTKSSAGVAIVADVSFGGKTAEPIFKAKITYIIQGSGDILVNVNGDINKEVKHMPRLGIIFEMPEENEQFSYYGCGPMESYIDKNLASLVDVYNSTATDNFEHYVRPQENSTHFGTKWSVVGEDGGYGLFLSGYGIDSFGVNASHFTPKMLTETAHDYELEPKAETVVCMDYKQEGIGSGSCGPVASEKYHFDKKDVNFTFRIKPVDMNDVKPFDLLNESF